MADIDVGQVARSLGNIFAIFQQNKQTQRRETRADERFALQQENFLATQQINRDREERLAAQSEASIAARKADIERSDTATLVNIAAESGFEIAQKVARSMGKSEEFIANLGNLEGIKNASRQGVSSTVVFQSILKEGGTIEQALSGAADPDSVDSSAFSGQSDDPNKLDPLAFRLLLEGTITKDEATVIDAISDGTFESLPLEMQALFPGAMSKLKQGAQDDPLGLAGKDFGQQVKLLESLEPDPFDPDADPNQNIIARRAIEDSLAQIQQQLLSPEEKGAIQQQQASRGAGQKATEKEAESKARIRGLEPPPAFRGEATAARKQAFESLSLGDIGKAAAKTLRSSIGSTVDNILFSQSFLDVRTGQVVKMNESNREVFQKAIDAGILVPLPRGEGGKRLLRQGTESGGGDLLRRLGGLDSPQPKRKSTFTDIPLPLVSPSGTPHRLFQSDIQSRLDFMKQLDLTFAPPAPQ